MMPQPPATSVDPSDPSQPDPGQPIAQNSLANILMNQQTSIDRTASVLQGGVMLQNTDPNNGSVVAQARLGIDAGSNLQIANIPPDPTTAPDWQAVTGPEARTFNPVGPTVATYDAISGDYVVGAAFANARVNLPVAPESGSLIGIEPAQNYPISVYSVDAAVGIWRTAFGQWIAPNAPMMISWPHNIVLMYVAGANTGTYWTTISDLDAVGAAVNNYYSRRYYSPDWGPTAAGTWYVVNWNVADGGDQTLWNSSGHYVCPVTGNYHVTVSYGVGTTQNPTLFGVAFGRGSQERVAYLTAPSAISLIVATVSGTIACTAGQAIVGYAGNGSANLFASVVSGGARYQTHYMEVMRV